VCLDIKNVQLSNQRRGFVDELLSDFKVEIDPQLARLLDSRWHTPNIGARCAGCFTFPRWLVEALIALSIAFLAAEIVRQQKDRLIWRHPMTLEKLDEKVF